jgi:hypothetical protein
MLYWLLLNIFFIWRVVREERDLLYGGLVGKLMDDYYHYLRNQDTWWISGHIAHRISSLSQGESLTFQSKEKETQKLEEENIVILENILYFVSIPWRWCVFSSFIHLHGLHPFTLLLSVDIVLMYLIFFFQCLFIP